MLMVRIISTVTILLTAGEAITVSCLTLLSKRFKPWWFVYLVHHAPQRPKCLVLQMYKGHIYKMWLV